MNKHTAKFQGVTFKRNSQNRIYTHAVVLVQMIADVRAKAEAEARKSWARDLPYLRSLVDGTSDKLVANGYQYSTPENDAERIAQAQKMIEAGEDGAVAEAISWHEKHVAAAAKTADGLGLVTCGGWCGRYDLAQKLAGTLSQYGQTHIVEARR